MNWYLKVIKDNYADFEGRARRKEYWMFILIHLIIILVLYGLVGAGIAMESSVLSSVGGGLAMLYVLATLVPNIAVIIRRLHEIGKSGWYYFIAFIPFIGGIWILVLLATEGDNGDNEYGTNPKLEAEPVSAI